MHDAMGCDVWSCLVSEMKRKVCAMAVYYGCHSFQTVAKKTLRLCKRIPFIESRHKGEERIF